MNEEQIRAVAVKAVEAALQEQMPQTPSPEAVAKAEDAVCEAQEMLGEGIETFALVIEAGWTPRYVSAGFGRPIVEIVASGDSQDKQVPSVWLRVEIEREGGDAVFLGDNSNNRAELHIGSFAGVNFSLPTPKEAAAIISERRVA